VADDLPRFNLTAATYNVCKINCSQRYPWAQRRQAVARTIAAAAPDVLAVQEAPTLPWRGTTQWADLTELLAGIGYQQPSDEDGCTEDCTRGSHIYVNADRVRPYAMPRPSGQDPPPAPCMAYLNDPNLPDDKSGPHYKAWREHSCRDFLDYSPTVDISAGMASQRHLSGIGWGPIQDRNISWAYVQEISTGTVFLTVLALSFGGDSMRLPLPDARDASLLLVLAIACTLFPFALSLVALRNLSAFSAQLAVSLEPVYAVVLAMLLLSEQRELSLQFYAGLALILGSVFAHAALKRA
jgi:hypothetical protein